jgi:DNA-binding MarR family transcriptional regulator
MHPFEDHDRRLLEIISRGEFTINGLRNKDLQPLFYTTTAKSTEERRRRSSAISRNLRLLRAHHLIRKVPGSHRYHLTPIGRQIATAVIAASQATVNLPIPKAA